MILTLAGRRIDAFDVSPPRFPLSNVPTVSARLAALFTATQARALVCAAACGADLVALEAAHQLGIATHIVLPFARALFRTTSVIDRPGDWGSRFDAAVARAEAAHTLLELDLPPTGDDIYLIANQAILTHALSVARAAASPAAAVLVWDQASRDSPDVTAAFADEARWLGLPIHEISTLEETAAGAAALPLTLPK